MKKKETVSEDSFKTDMLVVLTIIGILLLVVMVFVLCIALIIKPFVIWAIGGGTLIGNYAEAFSIFSNIY